MTYDPVRRVTVLFGGVACADGGALGDLWEYDGGTWTQRSFASAPPPRARGALTYDRSRNALVLFSGYVGPSNAGNYLTDTWLLEASGWRALDAGTPPSGRIGRLAYDPDRAASVLFGGSFQAGPAQTPQLFQDLWELRSTWNVVNAANAPSPRTLHGTVYAPSYRGVLVFGGFTNQTPNAVNDGALLSLDDWRTLSWVAPPPVPPAPSAPVRWDFAEAFDGLTGEVLIIGGRSTPGVFEASTFSLTTTEWRPQPPLPGPRASHAAAYDEARNVIVVFGGESDAGCFGDTLEY